MNITAKGVEFIVEEETGGRAYYEKVYKSTFCWPEGQSGCTAMVGVDIGYYTEAEVTKIFGPLVSAADLKLIQAGRGLKADEAEFYVKKLKHIKFPWETALATFEKYIEPKFVALTEKTFPGVDRLAPPAQTAMLSLVFNRGNDLKGPRRREMASLVALIADKDYKGMAAAFRAMRRLWSPSNGLYARRGAEAALIDSCV